jgi:hypothetical protein
MTEDATVPSGRVDLRRDVMKAPDEVSAMQRLKGLGWGSKRIAAELGCSRNTVRYWLAQGDWRPCASPSRSKKKDGLSERQETVSDVRALFRGLPAILLPERASG